MALAIGLMQGCSGGGSGTAPAVPISTAPPPAPPPSPPAATNIESETDVLYGTGMVENSAVPLLLDIYQPEGECTELRPVVVGIHGGGFTGGSKSQNSWITIMEEVVQRGLVGLSIDYRVVAKEPVISAEFQPVLDGLLDEADRIGASVNVNVLNAAVAAFEDTVTALEWARDNAADRCLDMDRFALWGSSAGAITSLHVAHGLDEYFIDRPDPAVVVDYWGRMFIEGQLDADGPPLLIIHGTNDQIVEFEQAQLLSAEAQSIGLPLSFYTIQDGPHGFPAIAPNRVSINGQAPLDATLDFIEAHLRDGTPVYEVQTIEPAP